MRVLTAALFVLGFSDGLSAADEKLDEKFLVGIWSIKLVNGTGKEDKAGHTIEFREDGTFTWTTGGKVEGTYKVKDTQLILNQKNGKAIVWRDMAIKDGKLIRTISKTQTTELTRIEKKDKN